MNGNSFVGFSEYEDIPLEQFWLMLKIHNDAVEEQNKAIEKARNK